MKISWTPVTVNRMTEITCSGDTIQNWKFSSTTGYKGKLLALNFVKDLKTNDKFIALYSAGYQPKEIAEVLGTTPNTVSVGLSKIKKPPKKR